MPRTSSRSSAAVKRPAAARCSAIRRASVGPTPGRRSNSATLAVLMIPRAMPGITPMVLIPGIGTRRAQDQLNWLASWEMLLRYTAQAIREFSVILLEAEPLQTVSGMLA